MIVEQTLYVNICIYWLKPTWLGNLRGVSELKCLGHPKSELGISPFHRAGVPGGGEKACLLPVACPFLLGAAVSEEPGLTFGLPSLRVCAGLHDCPWVPEHRKRSLEGPGSLNLAEWPVWELLTAGWSPPAGRCRWYRLCGPLTTLNF